MWWLQTPGILGRDVLEEQTQPHVPRTQPDSAPPSFPTLPQLNHSELLLKSCPQPCKLIYPLMTVRAAAQTAGEEKVFNLGVVFFHSCSFSHGFSLAVASQLTQGHKFRRYHRVISAPLGINSVWFVFLFVKWMDSNRILLV